MATKLYPPQIDGILPAFYKTYTEDGEVKNAAIAIPFGMNRAVTLEEVYKLSLRLKTVSTNTIIYVGECDSFDRTELIAYFTIDKETAEKLNEGQFYKAQMAFVNKNEIDDTKVVGYYSTVGTIKCVAKPKVTIAGYDALQINTFIQEFIGEYQQNTNFGDSTEKVETYEFNLWDNTNELILSSGELLHNSADDVSSSSSTDVFKIFHEINQGELYYIQYTVTTLNNLHISSPLYKVMQGTSVDIQYPLKLFGTNNFDEGYIELRLDGELNDSGVEKVCTGTFLITRGSEIDNYFEWDEIVKFNMEGKLPSSYSFRDFTVAQGIKYKYRIQQYNQYDLYSNPVYMTYSWKDYKNEICEASDVGKEKEILADFEDMFIYDGKRQLKVKYNPKVSSFKNTIPEQKIETIGSKYPFIFRSGHVNYKEFPISGLISFNMDSAMLFLTEQELVEAKLLEPTYVRHSSGYEKLQELTQKEQSIIPNSLLGHESAWNAQAYKNEDNSTSYTIWPAETVQVLDKEKKVWQSGAEYVYNDWLDLSIRTDKNLTTENLMGERYFKLKVLDWLTDGQVKLFRSPGEGNYLVRILNVSMTPQDALGRMLHTFSGTCYEIDELTYNNLIHYGIVTENIFTLMEMHWGSINVNEYIINKLSPWADFTDADKNPQTIDNWNGYYLLPLKSETVIGFECTDFVPGDKLWITYTGSDDDEVIIIGETGAYSYLFDDRTIEKIAFMPNPDFINFVDYPRIINYCYEGIQNRKFDTIKNIFGHTEVSKQYIGPYDNVFEQYKLYIGEGIQKEPIFWVAEGIDYANDADFQNIKEKIRRHPNIILGDNAGGYTAKFDTVQVEILHAYRRPLIPIFAIGDFSLQNNEITTSTKFALTPFGNGYVNYERVYGPYYYPVAEDDALGEDEQLYYKNGNEYVEFTNNIPEGTQLYVREDQIRAIPTNVLERILEENQYYINTYDLENINFVIGDELGTPFSNFEIYQVFIPIGTGDQLSWQALDYYYDVYYKTWRDSYNPTFSINDSDENEGIVYTETVETSTAIPQYLVTKYNRNKIREAIASEYGINNFVTEFKQELNNTNIIDMSCIDDIIFTHLGKLDKLEIGNGVMIELTFQLQVIDYAIEDDNNIIRGNKATYIELKDEYNKKLSNYFKVQTNTGQEELEADIIALEKEILTLAKNIDTHYINDDGTLNVDDNVDENGVPIINGSKDASYTKIIDSTTQAKEEAVEPKPLKQQLIFSGIKCFNDMLRGWEDDQQKWHYGLLQLHPFNLSDTASEILEKLEQINTDISDDRKEYFDYFVNSNINEYSLNLPLTMTQTIKNSNIVLENVNGERIDWWPYRAVPEDYASADIFEDAIVYGNSEDENGNISIISPDNSYQLFDLNDPFFANTMNALLFRIDDTQNGNKLKFYTSDNINIITPNEEGEWPEDILLENYYTYSKNLPVDNNVDINEKINNFISLQDFVNSLQKIINTINNLKGETLSEKIKTRQDMQILLNKIKNNYIDLLYLLIHSPYVENETYIKNPFLTEHGIENALQNPIEIDYANSRQDMENILTSLKPISITKELGTELEKFITLKYIQYISETISEKLVYYIYLDQKYIPVYPIITTETIIENGQQKEQTVVREVYWNKKNYTLYYNSDTKTWYILDLNGGYTQATSFQENTTYYIYNNNTSVFEVADPQPTVQNFSNNSYYTQGITYLLYAQKPVYVTSKIVEGTSGTSYMQEISDALVLLSEHIQETLATIQENTELTPEEQQQQVDAAIIDFDNRYAAYQRQLDQALEDKEIIYNINSGISSDTELEQIIQDKLRQKFILEDNEFLQNKVGRFIEAYDDLNIQTNELITNQAIAYIKAKTILDLKTNEKSSIPSGQEDKTVEQYMQELQSQIAALTHSIEVWNLVYIETGNLLNDPTLTDPIKRNELKELYNTAKYNKQIKELEKRDTELLLSKFIESDIYTSWSTLQNEFIIFRDAIYSDAQESYQNILQTYQNNESIYLELFTLLVDLLVGSDLEISNRLINDITTSYSSAISVQNKIVDYTNRTQYADIYQSYVIDLLNSHSPNIEIELDYFALLELIEELAPKEEDEETGEDINDFNVETYEELLEIYQTAIIDLKARYQLMETEMEEITNIYKGRASFIDSLDAIIQKYTELLEQGKTDLRKLLNRLKKLKSDLVIIDISNAPTDEDIEKIWNALTKYLLCLEKYYIQEVEGRYEI